MSSMKLGEKLSFLRKQNGMTQMELAEKLDISRQAVSRWERGTAEPSTENLVSIGKVFDVSVDALLDENTEIGRGSSVQTAVAVKAADAEGHGKYTVLKTVVAVVLIFCVFLSVISSLIVIYSALFKVQENDPIPMELYREKVDESEIVDGSDGWTIIED